MKAIDLINRAKYVADETEVTGVQWTNLEWLGWLNDAALEVSIRVPRANPVTTTVTTTAGASKQTLPPGGIMLLEITRCLTGGKQRIKRLSRQTLDDVIPAWADDTSTSQDILFYVYDERIPKQYFLYPTPATGTQIEICYSAITSDIVLAAYDGSVTTAFQLADEYTAAALDFMLFRAFSKDSARAGGLARATAFYESFTKRVA
jgi:hypothetical protein